MARKPEVMRGLNPSGVAKPGPQPLPSRREVLRRLWVVQRTPRKCTSGVVAALKVLLEAPELNEPTRIDPFQATRPPLRVVPAAESAPETAKEPTDG